ncbi:MAG: response regulator, partial [Bdellovibrionota bacterium]
MATTLLLADDSATIAKILGMALASEDYEIKSVLTAEDAVHELKKNPPFFFLVDLTLPGKSGFEFAEMIRADSKLAKIKVVLLSSAFEPVDAAAVKACGADLVIAKPFDPAELRASLRSIKDAPPKFASGSKVSGSLSGYTVKASEGTRTSLTDTDLVNARAVIGGNAPTEAPAAEELLLGMQGDQDANSILAGLAENAGGDSGLLLGDVPAQNSENDLNNATAMLDLSGHMALGQVPEPILDLSNSFGTPAAGTMLTAMVDMSKVDLGKEAKALESPPPP